MTSLLIITPVEKLQEKINSVVKSFKNTYGIYVSLNKTQKSTESVLKKSGINTKKLFFIDCVTTENVEGILHIPPDRLDLLSVAINSFIRCIKGDKFLVIDSLATLLIYNSENNVAKFAKEVTEYAAQKNVKVIAFSPKTQGEELLNKIFNFFDKVEKK